MKVYHGSFTQIYAIDLTQCKPFKDFGKGFYVTKFKEQAEFWADKKGRNQKTNGIVTEFEFITYALKIGKYCKCRFVCF